MQMNLRRKQSNYSEGQDDLLKKKQMGIEVAKVEVSDKTAGFFAALRRFSGS